MRHPSRTAAFELPRPSWSDTFRRLFGRRSCLPAGGFSLLEVVVAMLVLTIGMFAMAATSGYMSIQVRVADLQTERAAAVQEAVEQIRGTRFADIESRTEAHALEIGAYQVWWDVERDGFSLLHLNVHSSGPGYVTGQGWSAAVVQTSRVSVAWLDAGS
jgi:Tfp pilus assembly protein PilV